MKVTNHIMLTIALLLAITSFAFAEMGTSQQRGEERIKANQESISQGAIYYHGD